METVDEPKTINQSAQEYLAALASKPRRTDEEMDAWRWQNEVLPFVVRSGIGKRFHGRITEWSEPKQYEVLSRLYSRCTGQGAIFALVGPRGTGKTTICGQLIACVAGNSARPEWQRIVPYRKMTDLISRFKPLYADFGSIDTETLMEARTAYCSMPLAIIDELHECDDQKMKDRVLTDILDRRYSAKTDTVLISNQTPEDFQATTSDSVLSRLAQHGAIIPCEWRSFRTPQ
jgi:DNA replication protein DnaC